MYKAGDVEMHLLSQCISFCHYVSSTTGLLTFFWLLTNNISIYIHHASLSELN